MHCCMTWLTSRPSDHGLDSIPEVVSSSHGLVVAAAVVDVGISRQGIHSETSDKLGQLRRCGRDHELDAGGTPYRIDG